MQTKGRENALSSTFSLPFVITQFLISDGSGSIFCPMWLWNMTELVFFLACNHSQT